MESLESLWLRARALTSHLSDPSMTTRYAKSIKKRQLLRCLHIQIDLDSFLQYIRISIDFLQSRLLQLHQLPTEPRPNSKLPQPRTTILISLLILLLAMASTMPSFISRFTRNFTSGSRMSLNPSESAALPEGSATATVAAGCFWGVEHMFRREFKGKGLYDARVGYIGGDTSNPSYRAVCSGNTGRASPSPLH